jgi:hypothetical protein
VEPHRLILVLRRGAFTSLGDAAPLGAAAAVARLRAAARDPDAAGALEAWRPRPGKLCLRARNPAQWRRVLELPHELAGTPGDEGVAALGPFAHAERPPLLHRLQAMAEPLAAPPSRAAADDDRDAVTYLLAPGLVMSSGKAVAQVAHAAVMAAEHARLGPWVAAGCPGRVLAPEPAAHAAAAREGDVVARVVDAGLTEVPPGTVTVVALGPAPAAALPPVLRAG